MRLLKLSVSNFRGFGSARADIDVSGDLVLLYGPNGFGKTSLAEAMEWLFYGTTQRRMRGDAYSKTEYAGSFANVHNGGLVEVSARALWQGKEVVFTRRLRKNESSETLIDGAPASFATVGLVPGDAAYPIIVQHGLQSFIHSKPKDRRDTICAALGLDQLTGFKSALDSARSSFQKTPPQQVREARTFLTNLLPGLRLTASLAPMTQRLSKQPMAVNPPLDILALMTAAAELTSATHDDIAAALTALRAVRQKAGAAVFNLEEIAFADDPDAALDTVAEAYTAVKQTAEQLLRDVAAVAAATAARYAAALLSFWGQGLRIAPDGEICPMCDAATLGAHHRAELLRRIAAGQATIENQKAVTSSATLFTTKAAALATALDELGTLALGEEKERAALVSILPDNSSETAAFLDAHDALAKARAAFSTAFDAAKKMAAAVPERAGRPVDLPALVTDLNAHRDAIDTAMTELTAALQAYLGGWRGVKPMLEQKVAENNLVARIDALGQALRGSEHIRALGRYDTVLAEAQALIRSVEEDIQTKQNGLLATRGAEVKALHDLLNPGSNVGFDAMEPGTDSMKLHATSFGKRMPAAANLSECQLNCLGLAVWLMRATTPGSPFDFIVLDDPVQSMDDDHTEAFISSIVPHLIDSAGKQVIVLSHVRKVTDRLRALNQTRQVGHYHYESYEQSGPSIVPHQRRQQLLAEIKNACRGNENNRAHAVSQLRHLNENVIRELYLKKKGAPAPAGYDTSQPSDLLKLFMTIPDTTHTEHAGMKDTIGFCDPAHHEEVGYSVPVTPNILPHLSRIENLMKKHNIT